MQQIIATVTDSYQFILNQFREELTTINKSIDYCKEAINHPDIENWERKEYEGVLNEHVARKNWLENHLSNFA